MESTGMQKALNLINQLAAELGVGGLGSGKRKSEFLYWSPPKKWSGTKYVFAYTPWRTVDPKTGRRGFYALKYRVLRDGKWKLVKSVRFGRRKIAMARAHQWHRDYYEEEHER